MSARSSRPTKAVHTSTAWAPRWSCTLPMATIPSQSSAARRWRKAVLPLALVRSPMMAAHPRPDEGVRRCRASTRKAGRMAGGGVPGRLPPVCEELRCARASCHSIPPRCPRHPPDEACHPCGEGLGIQGIRDLPSIISGRPAFGWTDTICGRGGIARPRGGPSRRGPWRSSAPTPPGRSPPGRQGPPRCRSPPASFHLAPG